MFADLFSGAITLWLNDMIWLNCKEQGQGRSQPLLLSLLPFKIYSRESLGDDYWVIWDLNDAFGKW